MTDTDTDTRATTRAWPSRWPRRVPQPPSAGDDHLAELVSAAANLNDAAAQLRQGLRTVSAVRQLGATPRQITNGTSRRISSSIGRLAGYALRETSGAAGATVRLHDGGDANGDLLVPITLAANESLRDWFMPMGISFGEAGLFIEISGAIEGTVFIA